MRSMKIWGLMLLTTALLASDAGGQVFKEVPGYGLGPASHAFFEIRDAGIVYRLGDKGQGYLVDGNGKRHKLQVPVKPGELIEGLFILELRGDLLLAYDITVGDAVSGRLVRVRGKDLSVQWSADMASLNRGKPVVVRGAIYFPGLGAAEKMDASSGKQIWKYRYPFDDGYVAPQEPEVRKDLVILRIKGPSSRPVKKICLRDDTGQLVLCPEGM